jgi:hypothetical protein
MKATLYTAAVIFVTTLVSCGGNDKQDVVDKDLMKAASEGKTTQNTDTIPVTQPVTTQPGSPVVTGSAPLTTQPVTLGTNASPVATPAGTQPVTINTQPNVQPVAQQQNAAGINPAHGQPGHRCDIPVGSPLNSKPQPTNPSPAATISTTPPTPSPAQATAPGMNPPHGQPGHRCEIPVGSPLNSKPPQVTATPAITPKADSVKN